MHSLTAATALFIALAGSASATISVTFPVAASSCTGGQPCGPFRWGIDDSVAPPGADFGETSVGIYTGSVNQQTLFLDLGIVQDPVTTLQLPAATIPANSGPNGAIYFLRFQSLASIDPATGYPLQAFSAKFSLSGMTGNLSPEASAQINGVSLAASSAPSRSTSSASRPTSAAQTTSGTPRIGSNNKATSTTASGHNSTTLNKSGDESGAAGHEIPVSRLGVSVGIAAFLVTAAYLSL